MNKNVLIWSRSSKTNGVQFFTLPRNFYFENSSKKVPSVALFIGSGTGFTLAALLLGICAMGHLPYRGEQQSLILKDSVLLAALIPLKHYCYLVNDLLKL